MKRYAFLHKNFRGLDSEKKTIFLTNAGTLLLCLFPWYAEYPVYGEGSWFNAFGGSWFLLGLVIFLCALLIIIHIGDQLLETQKIKLPIDENKLYLALSAECLLVIFLAWSVLQSTANTAYHAEVRYGVALSALLQFISILTCVLRLKDKKREVAKDFFDLPKKSHKKDAPQDHDHHHPQNLLDLDQ